MKLLSLIAIFSFATNITAQQSPKARFGTLTITINGLLKWETYYKGSALKGYVEQFRWNKWITISSFETSPLMAKSDETMFTDSLHVSLSTGENKFRIVITSPEELTSPDIKLLMGTPANNSPDGVLKVDKELDIGYETTYYIYDEKGNTMLHGDGKIIDVSTLQKGLYYLKTKTEIKGFMKR